MNLKQISNLTTIECLGPLSGYDAANILLGLKPGDKNYNNSLCAAIAYKLFDLNDWVFVDYDEFGQERYEKRD